MKVAKKKDVVEGVPFCAVFEEKSIALFNVGGTYYAIDSTCTHMGGPLCQGTLRGDVVQCHGTDRGSMSNLAKLSEDPRRNPRSNTKCK